MTEAEYVFCKWKKWLWPAKVLSRNQTSRRQSNLRVKIFRLDKEFNVCCANVEPLKKETIEDIASKLAQSQKNCRSTEEVSYRSALREALNLLDSVTHRDSIPLKGRQKKLPAQKDLLEGALLSLTTAQRLPSHKDPPGRVKEQKIDDAATLSKVRGIKNESVVCSEGSSNHKPVRGGPSGNGKLAVQPRGSVSKAKRAKTPLKELQSSPKTSMGTKSACSSTEAVKHSQVAATPPSPALECLARTSTPAVSPSGKCHSRSSPVSKKSSGRPGTRKKLLASPTDGASAASELSKGGEAPPRKYSRVSNGSRHPQGLNGTPTRNHTVSSPTRKRRCRHSLEDMNLRPPCEGSVLEQEREENQNVDGEQSKLPGCEAEEDLGSSSDLSLWLSPVRESSLSPAFWDDDEEDELPSFLPSQELGSIEEGNLVWYKLRKYPYWPAVVRNVNRKAKKASVLFVEKRLEDKPKGFSISLRSLKHFDCKEKQALIEAAQENYYHEINWCINLIEDYRIRVGCNSFVGSFLEYCSDAMSYPVRKEGPLNLSQMNFPQIEEAEVQDSHSESTPLKLAKKILPDRTRAARDRANEKIVDFIVKAKGADEHLRSVLKREKPSRWLAEFLHPRPHVTCIETYLEDDSQQELVCSYLKSAYQETYAKISPLINGDSTRFILEVLFPEAIIYAISVVDQIDYKKAEEKYKMGPSVSQRERKMFEEEILEQKRKQHLQSESLSVEDSL